MIRYYLTPEAEQRGLTPPGRAYEHDAGIDLRALHDYDLAPQTITHVHTGVGFELPSGHFGLICNRTSGGARGILPMGHVVDAGYTGEIILILYNANPSDVVRVAANERIAQMVVMPVYQEELRRIAPSDVRPTERGARRLGSSGTV